MTDEVTPFLIARDLEGFADYVGLFTERLLQKITVSLENQLDSLPEILRGLIQRTRLSVRSGQLLHEPDVTLIYLAEYCGQLHVSTSCKHHRNLARFGGLPNDSQREDVIGITPQGTAKV